MDGAECRNEGEVGIAHGWQRLEWEVGVGQLLQYSVWTIEEIDRLVELVSIQLSIVLNLRNGIAVVLSEALVAFALVNPRCYCVTCYGYMATA